MQSESIATKAKRLLCKLGSATAVAVLMIATVPATSLADSAMPTDFHAWNNYWELRSGDLDGGTTISWHDGHAVLTLKHNATEGSWTSRAYNPHVPIAKLVSSWQADASNGAWIETDLSVQVNGAWSNWYDMGQWAFDNAAINRTSVSHQVDSNGSISQDTYYDNITPGTQYRLREVLHGTMTAKPVVRQVAATASNPTTVNNTASATTMTQTINLPVPGLSQYAHNGEYPQYDGGGEAWCSPTSVAMVLRYYNVGPTAAQIASLPADPVFDANHRVDGDVDYAVYHIFDNNADQLNTGDWPFNTAYAATFGLNTSVRQYNSLQGIEQWIKRGVPVVVSISWDNTDSNPSNDLNSAPIPKSSGHLMVVRGFTGDGLVIANDPAGQSDPAVQRIYERAQFERDWLNHSDGTVYIIKH